MRYLELAVFLMAVIAIGHRVIMRPLPGRRHSLFYDWYIHSPVWHLRRAVWFWTSNRRCEGCGRRMVLHSHGLRYRMGAPVVTVHHKHYRHLGHERRSDVKLMCWGCHGTTDAWRHRR